MIMKKRNLIASAFIALMAAGCLSQPDRVQYYYLSAPAPSHASPITPDKTFITGLRLSSADFLRARHMLVEVGDNQLRPSEDNIWEELPQAGFARVLSARFAQNLPNCQLIPLPSASASQPQIILEIQLLALAGRLKPSSEAEVAAEIRILDAKGHLIERDEIRKAVPWNSSGKTKNYSALAAAESKAAAEMADEIAVKLGACWGKMSVK